MSPDRSHNGYFSDIVGALSKYELEGYTCMFEYFCDGIFPSKFEWKHLIRDSIHRYVELSWYSHTLADELLLLPYLSLP